MCFCFEDGKMRDCRTGQRCNYRQTDRILFYTARMKSQKPRLQMHVECTFHKCAEYSVRKRSLQLRAFIIKYIILNVSVLLNIRNLRLHVLYILNVLVLITYKFTTYNISYISRSYNWTEDAPHGRTIERHFQQGTEMTGGDSRRHDRNFRLDSSARVTPYYG